MKFRMHSDMFLKYPEIKQAISHKYDFLGCYLQLLLPVFPYPGWISRSRNFFHFPTGSLISKKITVKIRLS